MSNPVSEVTQIPNALWIVHDGKTYLFVEEPLLIEVVSSSPTDGLVLAQVKDGALYKQIMHDVEECLRPHLAEARAIADVLGGKKLGES